MIQKNKSKEGISKKNKLTKLIVICFFINITNSDMLAVRIIDTKRKDINATSTDHFRASSLCQ